MSFSVRQGIGMTTPPGRLTPLLALTSPPTITRQLDAAGVDRLHPKADEAVVDEDVVPGLEHVGDHGGSDDEVARIAARSPARLTSPPATRHRGVVDSGDPELRALEVGDQRERTPELRLDLARDRGARARAPRGFRARS